MRRSHRTIPLLLLFGLAIAIPAVADVKPGDSLPGACPMNPEKRDRAHETFITGKTFFDRGERDKALQYYTDAYTIDCSAHFLLVKIADIWELKGNKQESLRILEEFMARTKTSTEKENASLREPVQVRIDNLKKDLAAATPTTTPTATTTTAPTTTTVTTTQPTSTATTTPTTTPPESGGGGHSIAPWILFGGGGAVLVTGGILTFVGAGKVSDADKNCNPNPPGSRQCTNQTAIDSGNSGRSLETIGVVVGAVGLAAMAGGLIWHFMEPTGPKQEPSPGAAARVTPQVAPGYAGVSIGGRF
jgi:hypothetical protein